MTINSRRPSSSAINRMASSRSSSSALLSHRDSAHVINATALPRSVSYSNAALMNPMTTTTATTITAPTTATNGTSGSSATSITNGGSTTSASMLASSAAAVTMPAAAVTAVSSGTSSVNLSPSSTSDRLLRSDPGRDSPLSRDPFVSISRAIQSAKLRANAVLRAKAAVQASSQPRPFLHKLLYGTTRQRHMSPFATAKRLIRMILFLVFIITLMSIVVHTQSSRSSARDNNRRTSKSSSFWGSLFSRHGRHHRSSSSSSSVPLFPASGTDVEAIENEDLSDEQIRALSALEYQQRHRPSTYNSPTLATGPWLLGLITDLDRESCRERDAATGRTSPTACARANVWVSILKRGILHVVAKRARLRANQHTDPSLQPHNKTAVEWIDETTLESVRPLDSVQRSMSEHNNRGMELSELAWFHGRLLAPDDRTGAVVEISSPHGTLSSAATARLGLDSSSHVPPSVAQRAAAVLRGRDGQHAFKAEWMVIKDDTLVIGGHGRPYTDAAGHAISDDPLWVNQLSLNKQHQNHPEANKETSRAFVLSAVLGNVDETPPFLRFMDQQNWADRYKALERAAGVVVDRDDVDNNNNNSGSSGFLMHEAVLWSHSRRQWIFLPRRRSVLPFDARTVATMGWNGVLVADEHFTTVQLKRVPGLADPSGLRGFSAAMFLPGSDERVVVALRTIEVEGDAALVDAQLGAAAAAANGGGGGSNRVTGLNEKGGREKWARVTKTFLSAFNIDTGEMVMNEDLVGDQKFEGLTIL